MAGEVAYAAGVVDFGLVLGIGEVKDWSRPGVGFVGKRLCLARSLAFFKLWSSTIF